MTKTSNRRVIAAVCCTLALALMALSVWDGIKRTEHAADDYVAEQLADISGYSSHYVRMYFENLMHLSDGLAPFIAQSDDILDEGMMDILADIGQDSYASELVVTRADGAYASTTGTRGFGHDLEVLLGDGRGGIDVLSGGEDERMVRVSTPIERDGGVIGALTGLYDADMIYAALSVPFCGNTGYFHVFMPDGNYVLRADIASRLLGDSKTRSVRDAQFIDGSSFEGMMEDVKAGRSGTVDYLASDGERMRGYYTLLGINDWYIICAVPRSVSDMMASEYRYILLVVAIKLLVVSGMLIAVFAELMRRRINDLSEYSERVEAQLRKQRDALGTLGAPPFEFDLRAMEASPLEDADPSYSWLMERILIPEHAGEVVDPRDEAAYLKLCDSIITSRGMLSGDVRLRRAPGAPTRMYRITLSAPEYSGDTASTVATLVDLNDVAKRTETLRLRAARDGLTGLDTLSELKIKAERLIERPMHHHGTLAFIRTDNQDAVCDSGIGMTQEELLCQCGELISDAMSECDVLSRGVGGEFWVFSGDQTGAEIIQKGATRLMESKLGGGDVKLTFSCGISRADPGDGIDALVKRAFDAAQLAHKDGGHRVQHG